jgi:hypothetical protein
MRPFAFVPVTLLACAAQCLASAYSPYTFFGLQKAESGIDMEAVLDAIWASPHPKPLAAAIKNRWEYTDEFDAIVWEILKRGNGHDLLRLCLAKLVYDPEVKHQRDDFLSKMLGLALKLGQADCTELLLEQAFRVNHTIFGLSLWGVTMTNDSIRHRFRYHVGRHPEYAASLAPTPEDFSYIVEEQQGLDMVDAARYCAEVSQRTVNPGTFDPAALLTGLVQAWDRCSDEVMASVAARLLAVGTRVEEHHLAALKRHHPKHHLTMRVL